MSTAGIGEVATYPSAERVATQHTGFLRVYQQAVLLVLHSYLALDLEVVLYHSGKATWLQEKSRNPLPVQIEPLKWRKHTPTVAFSSVP